MSENIIFGGFIFAIGVLLWPLTLIVWLVVLMRFLVVGARDIAGLVRRLRGPRVPRATARERGGE